MHLNPKRAHLSGRILDVHSEAVALLVPSLAWLLSRGFASCPFLLAFATRVLKRMQHLKLPGKLYQKSPVATLGAGGCCSVET